MTFKKVLVLAAMTLSIASLPATAAEKPLEHFFKKPEFAGFQLSPDGTKLAALAPLGDKRRMNIVVIDVESRKANAVQPTAFY